MSKEPEISREEHEELKAKLLADPVMVEVVRRVHEEKGERFIPCGCCQHKGEKVLLGVDPLDILIFDRLEETACEEMKEHGALVHFCYICSSHEPECPFLGDTVYEGSDFKIVAQVVPLVIAMMAGMTKEEAPSMPVELMGAIMGASGISLN